MSGFVRPAPAGSSHVVTPRDEKGATLSSYPMPPTPTTSGMSAGLLRVPALGPSLPMAETMTMPADVTSRT